MDKVKGRTPPIDYTAKIKASNPEPYDSNREGVQAFVTQIEAYLIVNNKSFNNEWERILYIRGLLKGKAVE